MTRLIPALLLAVAAAALGLTIAQAAQTDRSAQAAPTVKAGATAEARKPTAALRDLDRKPLGALLEQKLLGMTQAVWLERTEIDQVLKERVLTGLLGAAGGGERVTLGKLLKADVLILLRHQAQPAEHVQLVVCETGRGLRLAVHGLRPSGKVEADAEQLLEWAKAALARWSESIEEICAVPPFVSQDLTYELEHLKGAYAKLAEQRIAARRGVLLVEFEEAQAIGKELFLGGEELRRWVPLYVMGEYRHEGAGEGRRVGIRMWVQRGEKRLAQREQNGLTPSQAVEFVQRAAEELLQECAGVRPLRGETGAEAEALARRAEEFLALGSWAEAASLAEASLLLDPKQQRMRQVACYALSKVAFNAVDAKIGKPDPDRALGGVRTHLRALEHFETALADISSLTRDVAAQFWPIPTFDWSMLLAPALDQPKIHPQVDALRAEELELLLRMIRSRLKQGKTDALEYVSRAFRYRPLEEQFDIIYQLAHDVQHLPGAADAIVRLSRSTKFDSREPALAQPAGRRYLERLKALGTPAAQEAARVLEQELAKSLAAKTRPKPEVQLPPPDATGPQKLRFEPFVLRAPTASGKIDEHPRIARLVPAGQGTDVLTVAGAIYVMKEPGRPKLLLQIPRFHGYSSPVPRMWFDGRYMWVTVEHFRAKPQVFIINPAEERLWELTDRDGLTLVAHEEIPEAWVYPLVLVAPVDAGRAVVASFFGRLSICDVRFDPTKTPHVQVRQLLEARIKSEQTSADKWQDVHLAFRPVDVFGFRATGADGKPIRRAVVLDYRAGKFRPVVIDPDAGSATVHPQEWPRGIDNVSPPTYTALRTPEAIYVLDAPSPRTLNLVRIGLPDLVPEVVMSGVPEGRLIRHGEQFLVFGTKCWLLDPKAEGPKRICVLACDVPWFYLHITVAGREYVGLPAVMPFDAPPWWLHDVVHSNTLGLIVTRQYRTSGGKQEMFRVLLAEPDGRLDRRLIEGAAADEQAAP